MKISVAMTTYNGSKYIIEQLESLRKQERKPDEVIICDDRSSDDTVELIKEYIKYWDLKNWYCYVNKENLGWKKNFYQAIEETTGDLVFFCDQDDFWLPNKILCMELIIKNRRDIDVLSCTTAFMDGEGRPLKVSREALPYGHHGSSMLYKSNFDSKFIYAIRPGCTMAVRREAINTISKLKSEEYKELPHDALFWKIGTLASKAYVYNKDLIRYRIHNNNASAPTVKSNYKAKTVKVRSMEIDKNISEISHVIKICEELNDNLTLSQKLIPFLEFCSWRKKIITKDQSISTFDIINEIKYYRNLKMFLGDLMVRWKGNTQEEG